MSGTSKLVALLAAAALVIGVLAAVLHLKSPAQREFEAGTRFGQERTADACIAEICRTSLAGEVGKRTQDCHVQPGVVQKWCDQAHPVP